MTASLLGPIAAHYVASVPPAVAVAPSRRGKPVSTIWTSVTSVTATLPQTPTAGNLLIATVHANGNSTTPTCGTPTGWTAGPARAVASGTFRLGLFLFWKLATGSESNPSFTLPANSGTTGGVIIQEWAGLDATAPHLADSAGAIVAGAGALSLTDGITTTTANEWVFSVISEQNQTNTLLDTAWTLPQLSFDAASNNPSQQVRTNSCTAAWAAGCYPSAGAQAPHASFTAAASSINTAIASMSFKIAAGSRPQVAESVFTEATTASWTATLATTPQPADILICAVAHTDALGAVSISGCGATWTPMEVHDTAGAYDLHVWLGVNPTSAGTVTVTAANSRTGKIRVLRVSGTTNTATTSYSRNAAATSATGPAVSAGPGQLVVALQFDNGTGQSDFPITSASPALGNWATDALLNVSGVSGSGQDAWHAPTSPGTSCTVTGTSAASRVWVTCMVTCG